MRVSEGPAMAQSPLCDRGGGPGQTAEEQDQRETQVGKAEERELSKHKRWLSI